MNIDIAKVHAFHGHMCPGLAIGIRVAECALREMGERPGDEEVVAIIETDNCAVDAIQYLTGCTFGKGNLIYKDYGKNAFRFIRRSDGKAIRILVKSHAKKEAQDAKKNNDETTDKRIWENNNRQEQIKKILAMPLDELVDVQIIEQTLPPFTRIFASDDCAYCGESTMETRLRLLGGNLCCPECFEKEMKG